jgi:hypothetical protein
MAWVVVNKTGTEWAFSHSIRPVRLPDKAPNVLLWDGGFSVELPSGSIERLIGRKLTWENEPVELTEQTLSKPVEVTDEEIGENEAILQQERWNPHLTHTQEYVHFRNGFFDCWNWMRERMRQ